MDIKILQEKSQKARARVPEEAKKKAERIIAKTDRNIESVAKKGNKTIEVMKYHLMGVGYDSDIHFVFDYEVNQAIKLLVEEYYVGKGFRVEERKIPVPVDPMHMVWGDDLAISISWQTSHCLKCKLKGPEIKENS